MRRPGIREAVVIALEGAWDYDRDVKRKPLDDTGWRPVDHLRQRVPSITGRYAAPEQIRRALEHQVRKGHVEVRPATRDGEWDLWRVRLVGA